MFKVDVSSGWGGEFGTLEEAQTWIDQSIALGSFGKNERWLLEELFTGEKIIDAIDTRQVDGMYGPVTEYFFKKDYEVFGPFDITEENNKKIATAVRMQKGQMVRKLCSDIMDSVIGFNMDASRTAEDLDLMTTRMGNITSLLEKYRPFHAKPLIENLQVDYLVSQEMKDEILSHYSAVI